MVTIDSSRGPKGDRGRLTLRRPLCQLALSSLTLCVANILPAQESSAPAPSQGGSAYAALQRRPKRPASRLVAPPAQRTTTHSGRISLSFTNVDVRDILAQIADYSRTDILLTPGTGGDISISLRNHDPDAAIRMVAATAGLAVAKMGNVYLVGPSIEVKKATAGFGQAEVVPLRYVTPAEAADVVARVAPTMKVDGTRGGVVLFGFPTDIANARAALRELDVAPPAPKNDTAVVSLKVIDPAQAERTLHDILPDMKILRQERTLIMTGSPDDLEAADRAIKGIDVEAPKVVEIPMVAVYRLKYLNAQRAEDSLKKALPLLNVVVGPEPNVPPAANFTPLSGILGGGFGNSSSSSGGGGGGGAGAGGAGAGGAGGGASAQSLSRATRLIMIGTKADVETAQMLLEQTDLAQPQVRIEAALIEISESALKDLGIKWDFSSTSLIYNIPAGNRLDFGTMSHSASSFNSSLQALITQNKAHILATPNISVVDNEDANIFIGDLRRFKGSTIVTPNAGTIQATETIPVGIALLVRPHIHPEDKQVTLKVHPVVSTVSAIVDGLPQTASREADTTVRLREGEQLVIGGLDRTDTTNSLQKVPFFGDIPILGELFRTRNKTSTKTEIVMIIRCYPLLSEPAPLHDFRQKGTEKKK